MGSTASDGQTPQVEFEEWAEGIPYSKLDDRLKIWATNEFWDSPNGQAYELFETGEERVLGVGKNSLITSIFVVRFAEGNPDPTGIVIEFDNKNQVWSGPSSLTGNFVSAERNGAWHDYRRGRGKMDKLPGGIWSSWFVPRRCEDVADYEF